MGIHEECGAYNMVVKHHPVAIIPTLSRVYKVRAQIAAFHYNSWCKYAMPTVIENPTDWKYVSDRLRSCQHDSRRWLNYTYRRWVRLQFNYLTWSISTYKLLVMFCTMIKEASLSSLAISSGIDNSVSKALWKPDSERARCKVTELFAGSCWKLKLFCKLGWMFIFDADNVCNRARRSYKRERINRTLSHGHDSLVLTDMTLSKLEASMIDYD